MENCEADCFDPIVTDRVTRTRDSFCESAFILMNPGLLIIRGRRKIGKFEDPFENHSNSLNFSMTLGVGLKLREAFLLGFLYTVVSVSH